jgi:DNA-directed RNA polymerases I and III subunit RPAC2
VAIAINISLTMSVNEVKMKKAEPLLIRGTGPPTSRTFAIGNEDHTLGNALRHVLINNAKVEFAGYSVPHPSEPVVQIRVQTVDPSTTAVQALQEACETLDKQCEFVLQKLAEACPVIAKDDQDLREKKERITQDADMEENEDAENEDPMYM